MSEGPTRNRLEGNEGQEFARTNLVRIAIDQTNWRVLYREPTTGEYWEETFPHSEMHGGGPPRFEKISEPVAREHFNLE